MYITSCTCGWRALKKYLGVDEKAGKSERDGLTNQFHWSSRRTEFSWYRAIVSHLIRNKYHALDKVLVGITGKDHLKIYFRASLEDDEDVEGHSGTGESIEDRLCNNDTDADGLIDLGCFDLFERRLGTRSKAWQLELEETKQSM